MELAKAREITAEIAKILQGKVIQRVEDIQGHEGRIRVCFKGMEACLAFHVRMNEASGSAFTVRRDGTVDGICIKKVLHIKDYYLNIAPWHGRRDLNEGNVISVGEGVSLLLDPATLATQAGKREICEFLKAGMQISGTSYLALTL